MLTTYLHCDAHDLIGSPWIGEISKVMEVLLPCIEKVAGNTKQWTWCTNLNSGNLRCGSTLYCCTSELVLTVWGVDSRDRGQQTLQYINSSSDDAMRCNDVLSAAVLLLSRTPVMLYWSGRFVLHISFHMWKIFFLCFLSLCHINSGWKTMYFSFSLRVGLEIK